MRKIVAVTILCIISALSVGQNTLDGQESKGQSNVVTLSSSVKVIHDTGISFDISAKRTNSFNGIIEIKATLFNNNVDTSYFLTSTCDGDQYSLRYDTSKLILMPSIYCNASYPKLQKIIPKGQYTFQARFRCTTRETKINLGFDFYPVHKSMDLSKINIGKIHNRLIKDQNILWADKRIIK